MYIAQYRTRFLTLTSIFETDLLRNAFHMYELYHNYTTPAEWIPLTYHTISVYTYSTRMNGSSFGA